MSTKSGRMCLFAAGVVMFFGCSTLLFSTTIDYSRTIKDWPVMKTTVTKVTQQEAERHCRATEKSACSTTGASPFIRSCYVWDFDKKRDFIWYSTEEDLAHEQAHHRGHPHTGETADTGMQCSLDLWRKNHGGRNP